VKEIDNDRYEDHGENIREEINTMKRVKEGCNIICLLDVFQEPDKTYLIMQEMKGGDLLEWLYDKISFTEQEGRRIARKLTEAVRYCHKKKVAHRDIKPENILLSSRSNDSDIRLADFGFAKYMSKPKCLFTLCGSTHYAAPELFTHENGYNEQCDGWSIGVVIFVMLGGYAPFDGEDIEIRGLVCEGKFEFDENYWSHISEAAKNVIRGFLTVDSEERMTLEQALDSQWLRRRDVESLNLDGSCSTFDAWVRRQNESSQTMSTEGRRRNGSSSQSISIEGQRQNESSHSSSAGSRMIYKFDTTKMCEDIGENNDEDEDNFSNCSLSLGDL